jgi:hypothetical protein
VVLIRISVAFRSWCIWIWEAVRQTQESGLLRVYLIFSKCLGQYLAEVSIWLVVASILAAIDVSPALDDSGKPIDVRYALRGVTEIIR